MLFLQEHTDTQQMKARDCLAVEPKDELRASKEIDEITCSETKE